MSVKFNSAGAAGVEAVGAPAGADVYDDGRLRVEHDNYYAVCDGHSLSFSRTEFLLLSRLVRNVTRIVTAEDLWRHVWCERKPYNADSLRVCIYRLRGKLAPFGVRIEAMISVGYRLMPDAGDDAGERKSA